MFYTKYSSSPSAAAACDLVSFIVTNYLAVLTTKWEGKQRNSFYLFCIIFY